MTFFQCVVLSLLVCLVIICVYAIWSDRRDVRRSLKYDKRLDTALEQYKVMIRNRDYFADQCFDARRLCIARGLTIHRLEKLIHRHNVRAFKRHQKYKPHRMRTIQSEARKHKLPAWFDDGSSCIRSAPSPSDPISSVIDTGCVWADPDPLNPPPIREWLEKAAMPDMVPMPKPMDIGPITAEAIEECKRNTKKFNDWLMRLQQDTRTEPPIMKRARPATSEDIKVGAELWQRVHQTNVGYSHVRPRWVLVAVQEVLDPSDQWKAFVAEDGCRYGLDDLFVMEDVK